SRPATSAGSGWWCRRRRQTAASRQRVGHRGWRNRRERWRLRRRTSRRGGWWAWWVSWLLSSALQPAGSSIGVGTHRKLTTRYHHPTMQRKPSPPAVPLLKVGDLAKRSGVTVRTLHHYDS